MDIDTRKQAGSIITRFVGGIYEDGTSGRQWHVFAGGMRVAAITPTSVRYFHPDHLGGTNLITDETGLNVVDLAEYTPFGEFSPAADDEGYYYTGQYRDSESDLYYYGARYYNPKLGRFLTADWIVADPFFTQSYNRYSYVENNPVNYVDPSGNSAIGLTNFQLDQHYMPGFSNFNYQNSYGITFSPPTYLGDNMYANDGQMNMSSIKIVNYTGGQYSGLTNSLYRSLGHATNFSAGFGDFVTLGATNKIRDITGDNSAVNKNSGFYSGGKVTGFGSLVALGGAAALNAGTRTVLYSGGTKALNAARAAGAGLLLENTVGGQILGSMEQGIRALGGNGLPSGVWNVASGIFAANAKGSVADFLSEAANYTSTFYQIEAPIIEALRNAVLVYY